MTLKKAENATISIPSIGSSCHRAKESSSFNNIVFVIFTCSIGSDVPDNISALHNTLL